MFMSYRHFKKKKNSGTDFTKPGSTPNLRDKIQRPYDGYVKVHFRYKRLYLDLLWLHLRINNGDMSTSSTWILISLHTLRFISRYK